ncbi:MAG: hypothetical protein WD425_11130 [Nitrospirales bacterium]
MIKEFGNLSRKDIRKFYAQLHHVILEKLDLDHLIQENPELFEKHIKHLPPWSIYYELPYTHFLGVFFKCIGMFEIVDQLQKQEDPYGAIIDWAESDPEAPDEMYNLPIEEQAVFLSIFMAMLRNFESIQRHFLSLNHLIERARQGEDEALFDAVTVDSMVLSGPTASARIAEAEFYSDKRFFDLLSKAITKTRPRRPRQDLDDARYLIAVFDEAQTLAACSYEEIHDVLVEDLQVYPDDIKDSFEGLKKLISRRKRPAGT